MPVEQPTLSKPLLSWSEYQPSMRQRQERWNREGRKVGILITTFILMWMMLIGMTLVRRADGATEPNPWFLFGSAPFLVFLIYKLIFSINIPKEEYRPECPHCGEQLAEPKNIRFVISTKRCPACKQVMISEHGSWEQHHANHNHRMIRMFTESELSCAFEESQRVMNATMKKNGLTGIVLSILGGSLAVPCMLWLTPVLGESVAKLTAVLAVMPGVIVGMWGGFVLAERNSDNARPACDGCGRRLGLLQLLLATGNCTHCGCRVLRDAPELRFPPSEARDLISVCDFASLNRKASWMFGTTLIAAALPALCSIALIDEKTQPIWLLTCLVVGPIAMLFLAVWFVERFVDQLLPCPTCQMPLAMKQPSLIASRCCSCCGHRVLSD